LKPYFKFTITYFLASLVGSIAIDMTYGLKPSEKDDHFVRLAAAGAAESSRVALKGFFMVDIFPILKHLPKWFPGAGFLLEAEKSKALSTRFVDEPFAAAQKMMVSVCF
jgi:hypothetical protein